MVVEVCSLEHLHKLRRRVVAPTQAPPGCRKRRHPRARRGVRVRAVRKQQPGDGDMTFPRGEMQRRLTQIRDSTNVHAGSEEQPHTQQIAFVRGGMER